MAKSGSGDLKIVGRGNGSRWPKLLTKATIAEGTTSVLEVLL
jgi:hypothetical protein